MIVHAARYSSLDTDCEVALFTARSDIRFAKLPGGKDKGEMVLASPEKFEQTYCCQAGIAEFGRVQTAFFGDYQMHVASLLGDSD